MGLRFLLILVMVSCFSITAFATEDAYVTDSFKISIRRGPSLENKILDFLPSGMPVTVLEEKDGWTRVIVPKSNEKELIGWVLTRYLIRRQPWKEQRMRLAKRLNIVEQNMDACQGNLEEVSKKERELAQLQIKFVKTIDTLQKDYEALKTGSADYLKIKEEYEMQKEMTAELKKENDRLKDLGRLSFFGLGAFVLLSGLAIGVIIGRRNQKRSSFSQKIIL